MWLVRLWGSERGGGRSMEVGVLSLRFGIRRIGD